MKFADNEQLDDLLIDGRKIIQLKNKYKFTSDSVRLANFVKFTKNAHVCEFCSGSGIISILCALDAGKGLNYTLVELDSELAAASQKSINLNELEKTFKVVNAPVQNVYKQLGSECFDIVICNPPYFSADSVKSEHATKEKAETTISIAEIAAEANKLLKYGGALNMVVPAMRVFEIAETLKKNNFAIKRATFVKASHKQAFKTVLIEAKKGGKNKCATIESLEIKN